MAGSEESDVTGAPEVSATADREPAGRGRSKFYSGLKLFLYFAVVFAAGAGAGRYYMGTQFFAADGSEVPLIRADRGPVKVRPISPGGMEVPDRDKLVYDRMQGNGERPQVERLLPAPETPLPPPRPHSGGCRRPVVQRPGCIQTAYAPGLSFHGTPYLAVPG